jgi:hypothetical protein
VTHYGRANFSTLLTETIDFEAVYPTINWQDGIPKNSKKKRKSCKFVPVARPISTSRAQSSAKTEWTMKRRNEIIARIGEDEKNAMDSWTARYLTLLLAVSKHGIDSNV